MIKKLELTRSLVVKSVFSIFDERTTFFTSTGYISREAIKYASAGTRVFPCVGGMGYVSTIAHEYSVQSKKQTVCLDGDGSLLMHMGSMPSISRESGTSFIHLVLNNSTHESVGESPTCATHVNISELARIIGYDAVYHVENVLELEASLSNVKELGFGNSFVHVVTKLESPRDLPRPKELRDFVEEFLIDL